MADAVLPQVDATQAAGLVIHSIPVEFYGGKNPAPTEMPVTPVAATQPRQLPPQVVVPKTPAAAAATVQAPVQKKSRTLLIVLIVVGAIVLVGGGFALWWFTLRAQTITPAQIVVPPPPVVAEPPATPVIEATSTPVVETPAPIEVVKPVAEVLIPAHTFKDAPDDDADGLTDIEEELWGTNGVAADSDGDTFPDATEITNLYNPAGTTPERLIDVGLVGTYINPTFQYSVYYPSTWLAQSVDDDKKEVLFTSITQEFVSVRVLPFPTDVPFTQWFAKTFPDEQLSTYTPFVNKFKVSGVMSADGTVAVITDGAHVYLLTYNGGTRDEINYRTTFKMMAQSFKTSSVTTPIELLPKMTQTNAGTPAAPSVVVTPTSTQKDLLPEEVQFVTIGNSTSTSVTSTPSTTTTTKP